MEKAVNYSEIFVIEDLIIFIKSVIRVVRIVNLKNLKEDENQFNGVLNVLDINSGETLIKFHIGEVNDRTINKSKSNAIDLFVGHDNDGHQSSYQCSKQPGAIVADNFVLSFSGLPSDFDNETMVCLLAIKLKLLEFHEAAKIVGFSNNENYFPVLKEAIGLRIVI